MSSRLSMRIMLGSCFVVIWSPYCLAQGDRETEQKPAVTFQIGTDTNVSKALLKSPDGKLTIKAKTFDKVQLVEVEGNKPVGEAFPHRPLSRMYKPETRWAFSPDGKRVAVSLSGDIRSGGDSAAHIRVWEVATGQLVAEATPFRYNSLGYVRAMVFSDDGKKILVRCDAISGK